MCFVVLLRKLVSSVKLTVRLPAVLYSPARLPLTVHGWSLALLYAAWPVHSRASIQFSLPM